MRFPGFIGPTYVSQSVNVDCQRAVNLFPELDDLGTGKDREVASLVPTPGLRLLCTLPQTPVRGVWRDSNNVLYAVGGNKFYRISASWVATELGTLLTSSGPVSMADNGLQVVVVDGTYGYYWNIGTITFTQIVDAAFYPCDQVTYQDGYFLFNRKGTQKFFISPLNAVTPFSALDFASAAGSPDLLLGIITSNLSVYLFGAQSIEVFYNSGNANFPFERIQGAVSGVGLAATFSIAKLQNSLFFVGGDETGRGIVYRMQGYQAERISNAAIEGMIRTVTTDQLSNARAWAYQQGGHGFYCLNIPGLSATLVFDTSTSLWHERAYQNKWSLERHRADCHAVAYGENVVGDYQTGALYALDPKTYNDNGTPISRVRAAPHFSQDMVRVFHSYFQLDMEVGVGLDGSGQGTVPQAMLQWSDDGGHTWSSERWAEIGKIGQTRVRVIWRRLGSARDRVYRVTISDPVKTALIGAELGVEGGAA